MKLNKKFLKEYLNSNGPVGFEYELGTQKVWIEEISKYVEQVELDNYGTAYGVMGNLDSDFKVVIEAHVDEISYLVNYIDSKGYIRVIRNGGSDVQITPSMRADIWTSNGKKIPAIFGHPAIHITDRPKEVTLNSIFLDIGVKSKEEVIKLFLDNFDVLATHPSQYGETNVLEMKIDLVPGAVPYKSRVRPLNPDQKGNLRDQIDDWIEQGVIEPSVSPWASPLIPVKKKDGRTRWVTDLRKLNKQTVKDSYPLTNIQEILHSLQGATVFSSLDACGAYHAVRIEHGSLTAFISPFGTFQYIRMPFGLANAGSV